MFKRTPLQPTALLLLTMALGPSALGRAGAGQTPSSEDVQRHKQTLLTRMTREKPTYRGDKPGQMRVKWEWYDNIVRRYIYEKDNLLDELSAGERFQLRPRWVFNDMKVTFQELFGLSPEDDDKLLPILSSVGILWAAPSATVEGLTLYGKQGETKGTVTRKYMRIDGNFFVIELEYKNQKGQIERARGLTYDAVNVRWKDIKTRIADDVSEQKAEEDRKLKRDALEQLFRETERIGDEDEGVGLPR